MGPPYNHTSTFQACPDTFPELSCHMACGAARQSHGSPFSLQKMVRVSSCQSGEAWIQDMEQPQETLWNSRGWEPSRALLCHCPLRSPSFSAASETPEAGPMPGPLPVTEPAPSPSCWPSIVNATDSELTSDQAPNVLKEPSPS